MSEEMSTVELDMAEWPRKFLEFLIKQSCERDITVNKVLENCLVKYLNEVEDPTKS